jgi:hypothetical protein
VLVKLEILSLRTVIECRLRDAASYKACLVTLERLDENRRRALWNIEVTQSRRKARHDHLRKITTFKRGDLIMFVDS